MTNALLPRISETEARRVVSAAGLLASDKDGEALAAGRAICRLLAPHKIGPADVFRAAFAPKPAVDPAKAGWPSGGAYSGSLRNHVGLARACLSNPQHLTEWERGFLNSIMRSRDLSPKQRDRLQDIARAVAMKQWEAGDGQF